MLTSTRRGARARGPTTCFSTSGKSGEANSTEPSGGVESLSRTRAGTQPILGHCGPTLECRNHSRPQSAYAWFSGSTRLHRRSLATANMARPMSHPRPRGESCAPPRTRTKRITRLSGCRDVMKRGRSPVTISVTATWVVDQSRRSRKVGSWFTSRLFARPVSLQVHRRRWSATGRESPARATSGECLRHGGPQRIVEIWSTARARELRDFGEGPTSARHGGVVSPRDFEGALVELNNCATRDGSRGAVNGGADYEELT